MEKLQIAQRCGKLSTRNGWLLCPVCGKGKVLKLLSDTHAENLVVHCKQCGRESTVNIVSACARVVHRPVPEP